MFILTSKYTYFTTHGDFLENSWYGSTVQASVPFVWYWRHYVYRYCCCVFIVFMWILLNIAIKVLVVFKYLPICRKIYVHDCCDRDRNRACNIQWHYTVLFYGNFRNLGTYFLYKVYTPLYKLKRGYEHWQQFMKQC